MENITFNVHNTAEADILMNSINDMNAKMNNRKTNDGHTRRYEGSNVVKPELEFRPTKNRHRYYPFIEVYT